MNGSVPVPGQNGQAPGQKMTLRRFVRVTIDNFRQLLQTISAPTTSLPMPRIVLPPASDIPPTSVEQPEDLPGTPPERAPAALPALQLEDAAPPPPAAQPSAGFGGDQVGEEQVGEEQTGDEQLGDQGPDDDTYGSRADSDETSGDLAGPDDAAGPGEAAGRAPEDEAGKDDSEQRRAEPEDGSRAQGAFTLAGAVESLLFVADEAVEPAQLARALGITPAEAETALSQLDAAYREGGRGLRLQVRNGRYQLVTAPEAANLIESFLNLDASARLSAPALETLAVVAYRQPVTRTQIEAVRGVDCSGVLRSLIGRGLLEEVGRLDAPGRPVLYGVTDLFMHHFGLTALHELPPLEAADLARIEEAGA